MRDKPLIIGNWKMHKTGKEASEFIELLAPLISASRASVWIAAPFTALSEAVLAARKTPISIGAQTMHEALEGPFTGEISAVMLRAEGVKFVLIGHSERRTLFKETDPQIHGKIKRAFQDDLIPVLCIGETEIEREEGRTEEVLERQIQSALTHIPHQEVKRLVLAYEPVWAIGTGKAATPLLAQSAHHFCRKFLSHLFDGETSKRIPILYGGSVKPENFHTLLTENDIDGALVGGASLKVETFAKLINQC